MKDFKVEKIGDVTWRDREERVDARLDRSLAEEVGAEGVDRPDARLLELAERIVERAGGSRAPRVLDRLPEPELQLARGGVRERDGDHAIEPRPAGGEEGDHPLHELRRLPRPGGRLDDERRVEVVADPVARGLVGKRRHGRLRRYARSPRRPLGFRAVRTSSFGPQTGR